MKSLYTIFLFIFISMLAACGTTDTAMREQGHTESYVQGFHDGRHSGMSEEGNNWEHYIRDEKRFKEDTEYKKGWLAGETEGKKLQDQAVGVGTTVGGAYSGYKINKEAKNAQDFNQVGKDAVKGADTSSLEALEK